MRGSAVDATADAAITELEPSNRRRLISVLPAADGAPDFLSNFSSLIVSSGGVRRFRARQGHGDGCRAVIDDKWSATTCNLI